MVKYSIVIPTYKHLGDCLIPCCESIRRLTNLEEVEILICANGCGDDGTKEYVEGLGSPFRLIWIEEPSGYTKSTNIGIKESVGEYVILLNNDTKILSGWAKNSWIEMLYKPFSEDGKVAVTAPMVVFCPYMNVDFAIFFCVMIKKQMFDELGILDEIFHPGIGEDSDFCAKCLLAGYKIVQVPEKSNRYYDDKKMVGDYPIWHRGEGTFANWEGGEELIRRNSQILQDRYLNVDWSEVPYATQNHHKPQPSNDKFKIHSSYDISKAEKCDGFMSRQELSFLAVMARSSKVVIEVGAWHGRSSRAIADNLPANGKLFCVDTWNGSIAEQSTHHASAKLNGGDHAFIEFSENMFDHLQSGKVIPLRMSSKNASELFKKMGVKADTVFIDASHEKEDVKEDIFNWLPIVKEGGILCGHDYIEGSDFLQVKPAVDEIFGTDFKVAEKTMIWYKEIKGDIELSTSKAKEEFKTDSLNEMPLSFRGLGIDSSMEDTKVGVLMFGNGQNKFGAYPEFSFDKELPKYFDAIIFNNEIDLLERRLKELFNYVDRFIIVEAKLTHSGKRKELVFHNNLQKFEKYLSKITYLVVEENEFPVLGEDAKITDWSWSRETFQRDYIMKGLKDCKDNDIIIISDCDEIPNPEKIKEFKVEDGIKSFSMDLFYYDEKTLATDKWNEAKICTYKILKEKTPCGIRYTNAPLIEDGGKHLSYQGGVEKIIQKISDTAHQEYNSNHFKNPERIKDAIQNGKDLFGRNYIQFEKI